MSDLFATKRMEGFSAKFVRFAGPDNFVIEVNGTERTVTRKFWQTLPDRHASTVEERLNVASPD